MDVRNPEKLRNRKFGDVHFSHEKTYDNLKNYKI